MKRCITLFNDGWADWESGPVLATLREYFGWSVKFATPTGEDAQSIGGVRARADMAFSAIDPKEAELILVIGSALWLERDHKEVYDLLRRAVAGKVPVGAICGATLAAAKAGILDERAHTSNDAAFLIDKAPQYKGGAFYKDVSQAVSDKGVVTASGNAPITFAAEIIRLVEPTKKELAGQYLEIMRAEHQGN